MKQSTYLCGLILVNLVAPLVGMSEAKQNAELWRMAADIEKNTFTEDQLRKFFQDRGNINALIMMGTAYGNTLLHEAVRSPFIEAFYILMGSRQVNVNVKDQQGQTPLHLAAACNTNFCLAKTQRLLLKGSLPNAIDQNGRTPLHIAARVGASDTARLLLQHHADPGLQDGSGSTPFHLAVLNNHPEVVTLFLQHRVNPNTQDNDGNTPLHLAVLNNSPDMVEMLLTTGARIDLKNKPKEQYATTNLALANTLMEVKKNIILARQQGTSPGPLDQAEAELAKAEAALSHAREKSDFQNIITSLKKARNALNKTAPTSATNTAIEKLAKASAELAQILEQGVTPLELAMIREMSTLPKIITALERAGILRLLENHANPNQQDINGRTPLHIAVLNNWPDLAAQLLQHNADPNIQDNKGNTPLHVAVLTNNPAMVDALLAAGARTDIKNTYELAQARETGATPLELAQARASTSPNIITALKKASILQLLANHTDPNVQDSNGNTSLHIAVLNNWPDLVEQLLQRHADPNIQDNNGNTSLHRAVLTNNPPMVKMLLAARTNPNQQDINGRTPLYLAVLNNWPDLVAQLLQHNADPNIQDNKGNTPLHVAVLTNNPAMVDALLAVGARTDIKNTYELAQARETGATPLELAQARASTSPNIITNLEKAVPEKLSDQNIAAQKTLFQAIVDQNNSLVSRLLTRYTKLINAEIPQVGLTPLELAVLIDNPNLVKILLAAGANPQLTAIRRIQGKEGEEIVVVRSPLQLAQRINNPQIMVQLLSQRPGVNIEKVQQLIPFELTSGGLPAPKPAPFKGFPKWFEEKIQKEKETMREEKTRGETIRLLIGTSLTALFGYLAQTFAARAPRNLSKITFITQTYYALENKNYELAYNLAINNPQAIKEFAADDQNDLAQRIELAEYNVINEAASAAQSWSPVRRFSRSELAEKLNYLAELLHIVKPQLTAEIEK